MITQPPLRTHRKRGKGNASQFSNSNYFFDKPVNEFRCIFPAASSLSGYIFVAEVDKTFGRIFCSRPKLLTSSATVSGQTASAFSSLK